MKTGNETFFNTQFPVKPVMSVDLKDSKAIDIKIMDASGNTYLARIVDKGEAIILCDLINWMNECIENADKVNKMLSNELEKFRIELRKYRDQAQENDGKEDARKPSRQLHDVTGTREFTGQGELRGYGRAVRAGESDVRFTEDPIQQ